MVTLFGVVTLLIVSGIASAQETVLSFTAEPTVNQVKVASTILQEAAELSPDDEKYGDKLKRARDLIKRRKNAKEITFKAAILCASTKKDIIKKALEEGGLVDPEGCDLQLGLCYLGSLSEARKLLAGAIELDFFNWDDIRFENPRINKKKGLIVDEVDGPNEQREELVIKACK